MRGTRGIGRIAQHVARAAVAVSIAASSILPAAMPAAAQAGPYAGVELNVLTGVGPQIAEPLTRRGKEWAEANGAKVNVVTVPFNEIYSKMLTDVYTKTNAFDIFVFAPQWMGDFAAGGFLEPLDKPLAEHPEVEWSDVGAFFRDFSATYQGTTYTVPLDGDFHMMYYRSDILTKLNLKAPNTWDDYNAVAKAISDAKLTTEEGKPVYGSCISKKRGAQAYWFISSIAGSYIQSQGTSQGGFFDLDGFKPLVNNEAFAKALDIYKESTKFGPPDELNLDVGDTRGLFTAGQCGLGLDWGDIGTLAIDKATSKVIDKVGASILPGSNKVLDRKSGKLVACDKTTCPYADAAGVNHAPFAAFGGWSGAISSGSSAKKKAAAAAYLAYVSAPAQSGKDVTIGLTGFNPYRTSHFSNMDAWAEAGMSKQAADLYLGAIKTSLNSPNMMLDLRVPNNQYYQQVVLDTIIAQYMAGEIGRDEAMQSIYDKWEEKTEELGRDKQLAVYKATLGVTK